MILFVKPLSGFFCDASFSWMFISSVVNDGYLDDDGWYFEVLYFEDLILKLLTQSFMRLHLHLLVTLASLLKVMFSTW